MPDARQIHLGQILDPVTLDSIADFICGDDGDRFPSYRSSGYLTRFFQNLGIEVAHDGSTRKWWVVEVLKGLQPSELEKVILRLVDLREYKADREKLKTALLSMNDILAMDDFGVALDGARPILIRATPMQLDEEELLRADEPVVGEDEFLRKRFDGEALIADLRLDPTLSDILQGRVDEVKKCVESEAPLATVLLIGSSLEGILLAVALERPKEFVASGCAPTDRDGKVIPIHDWTLNSLIDVAHDVGIIDADVKKFSHALRGFRNYVHPYAQMQQGFSPSEHTASICWQVFRAAYEQVRVRDVEVGR